MLSKCQHCFYILLFHCWNYSYFLFSLSLKVFKKSLSWSYLSVIVVLLCAANRQKKLLNLHVSAFLPELGFRDLKGSFERNSLVLEFLKCQGIFKRCFLHRKMCWNVWRHWEIIGGCLRCGAPHRNESVFYSWFHTYSVSVWCSSIELERKQNVSWAETLTSRTGWTCFNLQPWFQAEVVEHGLTWTPTCSTVNAGSWK